MPIDPDSTHTSRSRLLAAGKTLFARHGYEQASTAAIAREAGTSESQLVRYLHYFQPLIGVNFQRRNSLAHPIDQNFPAPAGN